MVVEVRRIAVLDVMDCVPVLELVYSSSIVPQTTSFHEMALPPFQSKTVSFSTDPDISTYLSANIHPSPGPPARHIPI
jgi:hypothetical protein